jgi:hypothetical protein
MMIVRVAEAEAEARPPTVAEAIGAAEMAEDLAAAVGDTSEPATDSSIE